MNGIVTLTTDFGLRDPWVAEVRGAVASVWARYPGFRGQVVDLGHDLPPHDVRAAAWFLRRATEAWPRGTVHLAVVDPGVGTERPAVACRRDGVIFVGPGNGLFGFLAESGPVEVVHLDNPLWRGHPRTGILSRTFHGRDLFAPAAAHLAAGAQLQQAGPPGCEADLGKLPAPATGSRQAAIVWIDRFGNAVTDLERNSALGRELEGGGTVLAAGAPVAGPVTAYGSAPGPDPFWYWGSGGTLEIAAAGGRAADLLGLVPGLVLEVPAT